MAKDCSTPAGFQIPRELNSKGGRTDQLSPAGSQSKARGTNFLACRTDPSVKISSPADQYHNPDPVIRMIGRTNESIIYVENQEFTALIDPGAQVSTICNMCLLSRKAGFTCLQFG